MKKLSGGLLNNEIPKVSLYNNAASFCHLS